MGLLGTYADFRFIFYILWRMYDLLQLCLIYPCATFGILSLQSDWSLPCDHGLDYAS